MITWTRNGSLYKAMFCGFKLVAWSDPTVGTGWQVVDEDGKIIGMSFIGLTLDNSQKEAEVLVCMHCNMTMMANDQSRGLALHL